MKYTPRDHSDYPNVCSALEGIKEIAVYINEKKREAENNERQRYISSRLKGSLSVNFQSFLVAVFSHHEKDFEV